MSRRIDIELTSALDDGTWTWRAAGARQPRGVLDGSILPEGAAVGNELKVEIEQEIDGITVLGVVQGRAKADRDNVLELLPNERDFQPVVETRAGGDRRRDRRRDRGDRGDRGDRRDRGDRGDRRDRGDRGDRRDRGDRGDRGDRRGRRDRDRRGPSFTPPPEVPQRPKPKRLRPGKVHRSTVLSELPEEQRPIAELALQGMAAVRQRLREENERAVADGRATMPEATVMKMAEELLPKLRVAEWLDRAEAALRQLEHLDLRDLRSVVAAAGDPMVARDESTRDLADQLKDALANKQEQELLLWFGDIDAALAVGRVIRALRLSSQPPKAGVPFPADIAQRLADSTNAALAPMDGPERWSAMLEAAAFSPVRSMIQPVRKPDEVNEELLATVTRLAPALPQVAALFDVEVAPNAPMPKPLRPGSRQRGKDGKDGKDGRKRKGDRPGQSRGDRPDRRAQERDATRQPADQGATDATDAAPEPPTPEPVTADTAPEPPTAADAVPEPPATPDKTPEPHTPDPVTADTAPEPPTAADAAPEPPATPEPHTPDPVTADTAPEPPATPDANPEPHTTDPVTGHTEPSSAAGSANSSADASTTGPDDAATETDVPEEHVDATPADIAAAETDDPV